ncbi:MOSC domain-containing protein [Nonomuraea thailandensis]
MVHPAARQAGPPRLAGRPAAPHRRGGTRGAHLRLGRRLPPGLPELAEPAGGLDRRRRHGSPGAPPDPLDVARFRPNFIVDGGEPFAEDSWTSVRIGEIGFRVSELCDRCAATTWDPVTQAGGKEPLRTLAKHRRWDGASWFGIRLIPGNLGELKVGDEVRPGA